MSQQQINTSEAQQDQQDDAAAGDIDADSEITKVSSSGEEWRIKLRITPVIQSQQAATGAAAAQEMNLTLQFQGSLRLQDDDSAEAQRRKWFREMRGWLMVLATVAASVTYQAGLNPPGGFWQDDNEDKSQVNGHHRHHAGDPALHDEYRSHYMIFYYFNATAFVTSLVIMVLLMSERFYHTEAKVLGLMLTTMVDLASLIGAYIAGTTRYFSSCIYMIVITGVAFIAVVYIGEGMIEICVLAMKMFPCIENMVQAKWCPIPAGVVKKASKRKEERKKRRQAMKSNRSNTGTCCTCCSA